MKTRQRFLESYVTPKQPGKAFLAGGRERAHRLSQVAIGASGKCGVHKPRRQGGRGRLNPLMDRLANRG